MTHIRIECFDCGWIGYMTFYGGHVEGPQPHGEWYQTYCPRCRGTYARYR